MPDQSQLLKVRVTLSASREYLEAGKNGTIKIRVREKTKEGRANARVREMLAQHLAVPLKNVRIIRGIHAPSKIILVHENQH